MESFFEKVLLLIGKMTDINVVDREFDPMVVLDMKGLCHDTRGRTQRVRGRKT